MDVLRQRFLPIFVFLKMEYNPKYSIKQNISSLTSKMEKENNFNLLSFKETFFFKKSFCSISTISCWNCKNEIQRYNEFCPKCDVIQKFDKEIDHFSRLNFERKININMKKLTKEFRKLQSKFHPDKFSLKSEVIYLFISF